MTILEQITELHPVRRTKAQKAAFRKWVMGRMAEMGYRPRVEENDRGKHQNIVVGDPEHAQITITAHYDTPGCIGIPNLMIPRNLPVYLCYQGAVVGGMLLIALLAGLAIAAITKAERGLLLGYFGTYMALLLLMIYGPANRHNVNDNTSGISALLGTMARIPQEGREKVAFILFDNEEKGCRGSKAYAREHLEMQHIRLVVNLDCVGVGENILLFVPGLARNMAQYEMLERSLQSDGERQVHYFGAATSRGNSDFRSFKCGVGISAFRRVSGVGFYTGDIHTWRDTEADQGNIDFLAEGLSDCVKML